MSYNSKYKGSELEKALDLAKTALQEHQPLKTINGQSIVGEGNIDIEDGGGGFDMEALEAYMPMSRDFNDDFNNSFAR